MRFRLLCHSVLLFSAAAALTLGSCRKENGIDNNNVISTPYGLYFADSEGSLYNTNDGINYRTVAFSDGYGPRAILVTGNNLLMVKQNVFLSMDNGQNFNPVDTSANPYAPWQNLILDVPSHSRVYLASTQLYGVKYSEDKGSTWKVDTNWDTAITNHYIPVVESFAQTQDNNLFAWDNFDDRLFKRTGTGEKWKEVDKNGLPTGPAWWYLGRFANQLLLTDYTGFNGMRYSNDGGQNWNAYIGLPQRTLYATYAPFDETLLVGTDSMGLYRLEGGIMIPSNNGLDDFTSVYGFAAKTDYYKVGVEKKYVYAATSTGLYRSEDNGKNWIKMLTTSLQTTKFVRAY